jgi:hypothetical protein
VKTQPLRGADPMPHTTGDWDNCFRQLALADDAIELAIPDLVPAQVLSRTGYLEAFPDHVIWASPNHCFQPAVCYHCYLQCENSSLDSPALFTCRGRCWRNEPSTDIGRLREFTMREVVLFGEEYWLREEREAWMQRVRDLAIGCGMRASLHPATDPFFSIGRGRGKKLLQQIKGLKYELRVDIGERRPLAVASFNLHGTFLGAAFNIHLANGQPAASACFAFGLERWALAAANRGSEPCSMTNI